MISYKNRFHGHGSLQYLYKTGKMVRSGVISLRYSPNLKRRDYRLAVVVSRKVSKSAVVRNRIRRRLYECVRILSTNFTGVFDMTLLVYDEKFATEPHATVQREIELLLKKAAIITNINGQPTSRAIVDKKE